MTGEQLDLRELLERLVKAQIGFVLVGGLAVNAWGYLRATRDVDLVPDPDPRNLAALGELLASLGGRVQVRGGALSEKAIGTFLSAGDRTLVSTDLGTVDVLQGLPQVPRFDELARDALEVDIGELKVKVCSLESLLAMKRASERARDRDDLEALEAAHGPPEQSR
jgi:predicted nucleotidyltransferase